MSKPTFEKFNYTLRPAKSVERKMLCDSFLRLCKIQNISRYKYIGFGSLSFADLSLVHKRLGINDMESIECKECSKDRFNFNKPFSCIDIHWGKSSVVLPKLRLDNKRLIIWLDYECHLDKLVLNDIYNVASSVRSGSVIIVTVLADPAVENSGADVLTRRMQQLESRVGRASIPAGTLPKHLAKWGLAKVYREIINSTIEKALSERSGVLEKKSKLKYQQLYNFHYADGTKMLTVGGIITNQRDSDRLGHDAWGGLSFIRKESESCLIEVPVLTWRETVHLDQVLLDNKSLKSCVKWLPFEEKERYQKIYRYSPTFIEAEL